MKFAKTQWAGQFVNDLLERLLVRGLPGELGLRRKKCSDGGNCKQLGQAGREGLNLLDQAQKDRMSVWFTGTGKWVRAYERSKGKEEERKGRGRERKRKGKGEGKLELGPWPGDCPLCSHCWRVRTRNS